MPKEEIELPKLVEINILLFLKKEILKNGESIEIPNIIGVYTKDPDGAKTLEQVKENLERTHPEQKLGVWTYCTNNPNG